MKTLKEFIAGRKYVQVIYDDASQKKLRDWAVLNGFNLSVNYSGEKQSSENFVFHTTVFYTENEVNLRNKEIKETPTEVIISGIKLLGENKNVPVLTLEYSGGLKDIREHFERLGLKDEWPSYLPHISLSYAKENVDIKKITLPNFRPMFDKIVIEDIKD